MTTIAASSDVLVDDAPLSTRFARDGYVVLEQVLSPEEVRELIAEAVGLCRGELGAIDRAPEATDADTDDDVMRRYLCIHNPHKLSALIRRHMQHPITVAALQQLIGPDVKAMQSMLFVKPEGKPGQAWHQDEYFIPTRDRSLTAAWTALDDATVENGCLWVLRGSHRPGVIYPTREHDDRDYDCTDVAYDFPHDDADAVPVEVAAGSTVVFNGYLLHKSLPHRGPVGYRRALVHHYMSAQSLLPWFKPGPEVGQMGGHDFRDIVMVSGVDPYAWKGTQEIHVPRLRPEGSGGCDR